MAPLDELSDWERLLAAERHLQYLVPGTTVVGDTAAALHARHRISMDGDHVLEDLRDRFDDVLATLEAVAGWQTARVRRPVLILGQLDGVLTGIRQLRRTRPLETEEVDGLRVPTLAEMARIKAWLVATRNTVRDYLDTVVLFERLGEEGLVSAMRPSTRSTGSRARPRRWPRWSSIWRRLRRLTVPRSTSRITGRSSRRGAIGVTSSREVATGRQSPLASCWRPTAHDGGA
jgi:hypothetical protein